MQFCGVRNAGMDTSVHSLPAAANPASYTCNFPRAPAIGWRTTVSNVRIRHVTASRVSMCLGRQNGGESPDRLPVADIPEDSKATQSYFPPKTTTGSRPAELARLTALLGSLSAELEEKKRLSSATPAVSTPTPERVSAPLPTSRWRPETSANPGGRDTHGGAAVLPAESDLRVQSGRKVSGGLELVNRAELVAVRTRLSQKLSQANAYNRFLLREALGSEKSIKAYKGELSVMASQLEALLSVARELAFAGPQGATKKINGKFVASHVLNSLERLHGLVSQQAEDVDAMDVREVPLTWTGMAEDVRVMGSFDGWTEGAQLSPEELGTPMRFGGVLKLRPGR